MKHEIICDFTWRSDLSVSEALHTWLENEGIRHNVKVHNGYPRIKIQCENESEAENVRDWLDEHRMCCLNKEPDTTPAEEKGSN